MIRVLTLSSLLAIGAGSPLLSQSPSYQGCPVFPADNVWNAPIDTLPVDANSDAYVNTIGSSSPTHPDFGSSSSNGIPVNVVNGSQPKVNIAFYYAADSDAGPYPIPANPVTEAGSDHHLIIVDNTNCIDYEIYNVTQNSDGSWSAGSGAIFPLTSNQLRTAGFTSADAAGLPILPGLVKYDEVASGTIRHAIRFTAPATAGYYIWPARHEASSNSGPAYPPMGQRFRLKKSFDVSSFAPHVQVILNAMKTYGIILADNGAPWFISGMPDSRWNDDELHQLTQVTGSNFEAVDESSLMIDPNSAQAQQPSTTLPTNQWVRMISKKSGKCLEVPEAANGVAGVQLDQSTCSGGLNQNFKLTPTATGYEISIQSSGLQMDVQGGPNMIRNGAPVIQYPFWGGTNERWTVSSTGDGYYTIAAVSSGKCLDIAHQSTADGALAQQWACWSGDNQKWDIQP